MWFGYKILKKRYTFLRVTRYVFLLLRPGFSLKVTWSAFERKKFLKLVLEIWISITKFSDIKKSWIICFLLSIVLLREGFKKNYETYNNKQKKHVFAINSKFQIESSKKHSCILVYLYICILAYLHVFILSYFNLAYVHTWIPTYLLKCILAYLSTCILPCLHNSIPVYSHTW